MSDPFILTIRCRDAVGIVAAVSSALAAADAFIIESSHYGDADTGLFFMRTVFRPTGAHFVTRADFQTVMAPVAQRFEMALTLHEAGTRMKVLLAVSKHGHCLNHLLHQWHSDELPIDVVGVVSNHDDLRRKLEGRCINIHHSFLPSFKGAKPYHQAHARGVKVVGATAHYVTGDLDEGPIIEQETQRVAHNLSAEAFVRMGKDIESVVLARAVRWHAEHRVMINGLRTVVF